MNTDLIRNLIITSFVGALFLFGAMGVSAQVTTPSPTDVRGNGWTLVPEECLENAATECGFEQMLQLIANIIGLFLVIALALATLLFGYAGFKYATAAGNPQQISGAKAIFKSVAIGLIIVFLAYTIVQVVVSILGVEGDDYNQFLEEQSPSSTKDAFLT